MKLLMENWRKFINEEIYGEEFLKTLGLTYQVQEDEFLVQIIHKNEINGQICQKYHQSRSTHRL